MSTSAATILAHLNNVGDERAKRTQAPGLAAKVVALKAYQQRRFSHTYADLLQSDRYGAASHFFLEELYGPSDFTLRDAQFARMIPALVRLFPGEIVETVAALAALHALSESLDSAMGVHLVDQSVGGIGLRSRMATNGAQRRSSDPSDDDGRYRRAVGPFYAQAAPSQQLAIDARAGTRSWPERSSAISRGRF